jgi:hypothetical protein
VGEINGGIKKVFFVLTRNVSWWGNQSLNENVFCLTEKYKKWAKPRNPFLKGFFFVSSSKSSKWGKSEFFFLC